MEKEGYIIYHSSTLKFISCLGGIRDKINDGAIEVNPFSEPTNGERNFHYDQIPYNRMSSIRVTIRFSKLGESIVIVFSKLRNERLLQPIIDTPLPKPLLKKFKRELFVSSIKHHVMTQTSLIVFIMRSKTSLMKRK